MHNGKNKQLKMSLPKKKKISTLVRSHNEITYCSLAKQHCHYNNKLAIKMYCRNPIPEKSFYGPSLWPLKISLKVCRNSYKQKLIFYFNDF